MSSEQPDGAADAVGQAKAASQRMMLETAVEEAEAEASKLRQERDDMKARYESLEADLRKAQDESRTLRESLSKQEGVVETSNREAKANLDKSNALEEESKTNKERMDRLMAEADNLREEISNLTKSNLQYKKQISEAEAESKLGESEIVPLRYQVGRLKGELDAMSAHSTWLAAELKSKTDELAAARAEQAAEMAELRADYDRVLSEKETAVSNHVAVRQQADNLESKVERLSRELLQARQEASENKLAMEEELVAERRLISLQKEQLDRVERRHDDVVKELESLQAKAREADEESHDALEQVKREMKEEYTRIVKDQDQKHADEIKELKRQLADANNRRQQAEDGLLSTTIPQRQPLAEIALDESSDVPTNPTDLYTRLVETQDALRSEKLERQKAEILLKKTYADIRAKGPALIRQRQEHELAVERCEEYQKRLESALSEVSAYRVESDELRVQLSDSLRRNKDLQEDTVELAKQVQALLVSKSGSGDSISASSIPSTVEEMQSQNQRLLQERRRLTETIAELEEKTKSDPWREKADAAEKEVEMLREERSRQEVMVDSLVQQRDLYRTLLHKHDSSLLGPGSEETSALQIVKNQSERTKSLQEKNSQLENELVAARGELSNVSRDKEAAAERLARYEALREELTKSVDRLQIEVSSCKAAVARSEADASFHREKCSRLEETLQRSREEVMQVTSSKNELQRITADLQKAVSTANAEKCRLESEMRQAQRKLGLAESEAESAAAAERRVTAEVTQLRNDLARQGQLIDSLHRIEANMTAKGAQELESMKEEVERLTKKLNEGLSEHSEEVAKLTTRIQDQDSRIKEAELSKEKAVQGELKAKNESLKAAAEMESLSKKCSKLEVQLRAAKRKLGESGDEKDVEEELQNTINSLKQELEASQAELATAKERAGTFQKLSKNGEKALEELTRAAKDAKQHHIDEVNGLKEQLENARKESKSRQEVITDLTNDLASYRTEREQALSELNKQIAVLRTEAQQYQKDADSASTQVVSLQTEVTSLRAEVKTAQENYERELSLHSDARKSLRLAKEETDSEIRLRKAAEEELDGLKNEQAEKLGLLRFEIGAAEDRFRKAEKQLEEYRSQNSKLLDQLQALGEKIEKDNTNVSEVGEADVVDGEDTELNKMRKTISELRELVKFLRSDKEMVQAQLDSARRATDRERAEADVVKRSLDEARAELKVAQESLRAADEGNSSDQVTALKERVRAAEEQSRLLGDSNTLLREEVEKLQASLSELKKELETHKEATKPSEERQKVLESEKAALTAEKSSLLREIDDWKKRVQSLVSKFNQVDPEEHSKALKKVESLESEIASLTKAKTEAVEESKRIRGLASRVSKDLMQNKTLVETQKKTIARLTAEKEDLEKSSKDTAPAKELTQLKEQLAKLETERTSEKTQLEGATQMNDRLRERLRQFQKSIQELRKKDATNTAKLKDALTELEKSKAAATKTPPTEEQSSSDQKADEHARSRPTSPHPLRSTSPHPPASGTTSASAPTGESDGAETPKETVESAPPQEPSSEAVKPKAVPKVPAGGFKFGPSGTGDAGAAKKSDTAEGAKPADLPISQTAGAKARKRPASETTESSGPDKKKTAVISEKAAEASTSQSAGELAVAEEKPSEGSESPKPSVGRRMSGENKEMSIKEKLLEKKRKLEAMKKAKEAAVAEKLKKRSKMEDAKASASAEPGSAAIEDAAATGTSEGDSAAASAAEKAEAETSGKIDGKVGDEDDEADGGQVGPAESEEAGEDSKEGEQAVAATETETTTKAATSTLAPTIVFGSSSTMNPFGTTAFGQTATGAPSVFGSSGFGSTPMSTFGAAASSASTSGAKSGFGDKPTGSTPAPFGSAFLDIKPPGSSTAPTQLIFGQSPSITLPTPAQKSPSNSMFSAFSSNKPYSSGGVTAKPLFGTKKDEKAEASKEDDDEEEGEVQDEGKES